jgi:putative tryptophan/tyrosine transport system substrate-binding protein
MACFEGLGKPMRRREFLRLFSGAAAAWPLTARAQQSERLARIGYLSPYSASRTVLDDAFLAGLRDLGYVEGKNVHIDFRFAEGREDQLPKLATELVDLNVDVIVTYGTGDYAAKPATTTIPIVMMTAADVVAMGIVASLSHPGGNITGLTFFVPELMAKRLELLKEVLPSMTRSGVLLHQNVPSTGQILEVMADTAKALGVKLEPIEVSGPGEFESVFSAWGHEKIDAFVMLDLFLRNSAAIAALAAEHHLPSIGPLELSASGGLMGYGVNFADMYRRAAAFVDKILKGTKPGDIPIEQATKFNLAVNLKTAKALGIEIPASVSVLADEVIE